MHNNQHIAVRKYRPRNITTQQLLFCEAYLAEQSAGKAARIVGYKSPDRAATHLLQCKRIKDYLNKRQKSLINVGLTFEKKMAKLTQIIDTTIPDEINVDNIKQVSFDTGIKAIAEANKMSGHYAPTQVQQVTIEASMEDIRNAKASYKKEV
jgi:phage terminase small subunit